MKKWIALFVLPLNLLWSGCAFLTKTPSIGLADLTGVKSNCKDDSIASQFFISLQNEKALVTIEGADEVLWIGPLVLPIIPLYDGSVTVHAFTRQMQPDQSNQFILNLIADEKKVSPEVSILKDRELRIELQKLKEKNGFHSVIRSKFAGRQVRNANKLELEFTMPDGSKSNLPLKRDYNWYYMPVFGHMVERFSFLCASK